MEPPSKMLQEALQAPSVVDRLLKENLSEVRSLADFLRRHPPSLILSAARGSSDHAALYGKYLYEGLLEVLWASAAPSIYTLFNARPRVSGGLAIALSQSGQSPDLIEVLQGARQRGALTLALVNQTDSPLARTAEILLPLWAGEEQAVAATKSYLAMLAALAQLAAFWGEDRALQRALEALPEAMERAAQASWPLDEVLVESEHTLVIGRGYGFAVSQELALKLKETSALHAEALSAAELLHGPLALIEAGFPLLLVADEGPGLPSLLELATKLRGQGVHLVLASSSQEALALASLPLPLTSLHPALDPLLLVQAFYPMAVHLARARGKDPDRPRHLSKVTRTF